MSTHELRTLLTAAQKGDLDAMGAIFERFRPFLLQIANDELDPRLRQKAGGSDLVQQTLLEAGHSLVDFSGSDPHALAAWLRRILLNNIANLRRHFQTDKRNIQREVNLVESGSKQILRNVLVSRDPTKSERMRRDEDLSMIGKAIANLSPEYQSVLRMRGQEKQTFLQIGGQLGRSPDAARKLWARAVEALKSELNKVQS